MTSQHSASPQRFAPSALTRTLAWLRLCAITGQSSAVLVAADPAKHNGARRARLFVTGFLSKNMVAVDVDL